MLNKYTILNIDGIFAELKFYVDGFSKSRFHIDVTIGDEVYSKQGSYNKKTKEFRFIGIPGERSEEARAFVIQHGNKMFESLSRRSA